MTTHLDDLEAQRLADGTLPPGEAHVASAHAAACAACAALVESHRALLAALDGLALPDVPADFTNGVLEEVDRRERRAAGDRRTALAVVLATAGALAVALLAGGAAPWVAALAELADRIGTLAGALHLGGSVLPGVLGPLRLPVAAACALVASPLLLVVPRLAASRRKAA